MLELLALPQWNAPHRTLAEWSDQLAALGHAPHVEREASDAAWLEVAPLRFRGYAVLEGGLVTAINFEFAAADPEAATSLVSQAAQALGWELHEDEDEDDDEGDAESEDLDSVDDPG